MRPLMIEGIARVALIKCNMYCFVVIFARLFLNDERQHANYPIFYSNKTICGLLSVTKTYLKSVYFMSVFFIFQSEFINFLNIIKQQRVVFIIYQRL